MREIIGEMVVPLAFSFNASEVVGLAADFSFLFCFIENGMEFLHHQKAGKRINVNKKIILLCNLKNKEILAVNYVTTYLCSADRC